MILTILHVLWALVIIALYSYGILLAYAFIKDFIRK